ncbi:ferredoxin [Amycolatopsis rhabdoformis]|uniref:Ferredoxin n=1 Tax=Amycolatopsis rhabdoformis TaxID=1448059 RepID=A0ABZ1IEG5_9PSEU|nr:ferredoxin [Amycolatopsis rhabdoformis]WSE31840.1 ferredoxin [Amycolatopsis rhabdoformis]
MRIEADRELCAGLGMCEAMAPDFFEVGDDGVVVLLDETPGEEHRMDLTAATEACPMLALKVRD